MHLPLKCSQDTKKYFFMTVAEKKKKREREIQLLVIYLTSVVLNLISGKTSGTDSPSF